MTASIRWLGILFLMVAAAPIGGLPHIILSRFIENRKIGRQRMMTTAIDVTLIKNHLEEIIAKLEKASGPDRELDAAIFEAVNKISAYSETPAYRQGGKAIRKMLDVPKYTASVDVALPIENDAYVEVSGPRKYLNIPTVVPNYWRVEMIFGNVPPYKTAVAWGATEALARRTAALKAQNALSGDSRS